MGSIGTVTAVRPPSSARVRDDQHLIRVAPQLPPFRYKLKTTLFAPYHRVNFGQLAANGSSPSYFRPVVKAEHSSQSYIADYVPDAKFYKVEAILRPWRVPHVSSGLIQMGIRGVTVSDVRGFGAQGGSAERQADEGDDDDYEGDDGDNDDEGDDSDENGEGNDDDEEDDNDTMNKEENENKGKKRGSEFSENNFVSKTKMEIVVCKDQLEAVVEKIIEEARTGEIGDGKIFVIPVSDVIRIRTGERGEKAEKMSGGRSDMIASVSSSNSG